MGPVHNCQPDRMASKYAFVGEKTGTNLLLVAVFVANWNIQTCN